MSDDHLISTYEVVDRGVLVELLNDSISEAVFNAEDKKVERLTRLRADVEAGRGGILTKERWEGTE